MYHQLLSVESIEINFASVPIDQDLASVIARLNDMVELQQSRENNDKTALIAMRCLPLARLMLLDSLVQKMPDLDPLTWL